jgi:hypothetical protein
LKRIDPGARTNILSLMRISVPLAAILLAVAAPASAQEPLRVAYFGLHFTDTSPAPSHEAETRRTQEASDRLVAALEASGRYVFVDTAPVADRAKRYANFTNCNGCDTDFARELGADVAMSGEIQKTSNLIISLTVIVRDAETEALIDGGSTDIRGNNDEMWVRGIDWLIENRLLEE